MLDVLLHGPGPTFLDCHILFNFGEIFNLFYLCNTCADEGKVCGESPMAEVRRNSATSFARVASSLSFPEQQKEETPQPHPPYDSPVEEVEQLTETPKLGVAVKNCGPRPQGGMWRGSEHGTHNTASICR